ncbi:methyltransferase [Vibrio ostreicida]|uniref:Methyltransferase n=1 Tax=Vibrio ostreicida TaxID=526588 RepID=A0ABT8BWR7_9VIBR|nr:methyltransferase [Vibrio ostreicida]MDN3610540.1 methyltransferase [Vibrio ostreicida]NPD07459.1 methyltransferase [Vibrio ostreicida]
MQNTFKQLDAFLLLHQEFWRLEPFFASLDDCLPWQSSHPELCAWLSALTPSQIQSLKSDPDHLSQHLLPFIPSLSQTALLTRLERITLKGLALSRGIDAGIPGRKLAQIVALGEAALSDHQQSEWLEWCAGKGFLGRILASHSQQRVTSFEFQPALCEAGQHIAQEYKLPMTFVQGDALTENAAVVLNSRQHAVALHACGDLHVSLIEKAVKAGVAAVTLSPCCYHLITAQAYQPLSRLAQTSDLDLNKKELRIPLQETVTGGERVRKHRFLEMVYRLGFDVLLRQAVGHHQYVNVPSIKKSQLTDGFEAFCHWAADQKEITLPQGIAWQEFEDKGEQRYWQMERISLIQQPFRRSLEMWLVLDKSLYLVEHGYHVCVETFCDKQVTPRNILIRARKKATAT